MKNKQTKHEVITNQNTNALRAKAEQWWARLSPFQRVQAQQIAGMMDEVTESKRIEIRRDREKIRARFIHILKRPEHGCASAIVLPEIPASWN